MSKYVKINIIEKFLRSTLESAKKDLQIFLIDFFAKSSLYSKNDRNDKINLTTGSGSKQGFSYFCIQEKVVIQVVCLSFRPNGRDMSI